MVDHEGKEQVGLDRTWRFEKMVGFLLGHSQLQRNLTKLDCLVSSWKYGSKIEGNVRCYQRLVGGRKAASTGLLVIVSSQCLTRCLTLRKILII